MMSATPAFTSVQARTYLARPGSTVANVTMAQPQSSHQQASGRVWSTSVRQYVQRAFAENNAEPGIPKNEMETKLRAIISEAAANNGLDDIDWDNFPLPQTILAKERKAAASQPSSKTPLSITNQNREVNKAKKRKSADAELDNSFPGTANDSTSTEPPWRKNNKQSHIDSRSKSKDRRFRLDGNVASYTSPDANLESRKRRFESKGSSPYSPNHTTSLRDQQSGTGPVVGRSTELEKRYFRLTSEPNPADVRPLHILEKTLDLLKKKWKKDGNYSYICDQFKSMRQDLTVQHIKNEFTVTVYEIHARIALEKRDLGEYNQCQTQLSTLYAQKLGGHPLEFKAYRILYFLHTCNRSGMNAVLADLTTAEKQASEIKHALSVRAALAMGNYHRFFKLYQDTPNMGAYLMDMFVHRERLHAIANITKAYKPDVKLRFVTDELAFESDEEAARFICDAEAQEFLEDRDGAVRLVCGKSAALFETAKKAAFAKIDIKGQI